MEIFVKKLFDFHIFSLFFWFFNHDFYHIGYIDLPLSQLQTAADDVTN